jgi:hypothetical protein
VLNLRLQAFGVTLFCVTLLLAISGAGTAGVLELLTHGSSGEINDAFFVQVDPENSTGTGVIQPFLHIQKKGVEEGYNTDYTPHQFPEADSPWTESLLLDDVPIITLDDGLDYRQFLLDVNENSGGLNEFISLDKLHIFLGSSGNLTGYPSGLGALVWDMDAGPEGDMWIKLDYSLEAGSGDGDMWAYIPASLFTRPEYVDLPYLYLYSMFGDEGTPANGLDACDGFEEWAVREPIPEPTSLLAVSTGLIGILGFGWRRTRRSA